MKKAELEQENKALRLRCEKLAHLLRSTQARALGGIRVLEQSLQPDDTCDEVGSEQVVRCEEAIRHVLTYLARIIDPAAHNQAQADQTVLQLRDKGLALDDELKGYLAKVLGEPVREDVTADMLSFIEKAVAQAAGKIALYADNPDERNDLSLLTEAYGMLCEMVALVESSYHWNGSQAALLLSSLIEATEELLANMYDSGEAYNDHEQEEEYGEPYPDVRLVETALAQAKEYLANKRGARGPLYRTPYPDDSGRALAVYSLGEFDNSVLKLCAIRFACPECHDDFQEALEYRLEFENRIGFIGTTVDLLIPDEQKSNDLLSFVAFNAAFFTEAPEYYASSNSLAPASIVYEQLYQYTFSLIENHLGEILQQATLLLAERQRLEEQLTTVNRCDVCGQEPYTWFWDPFTSVNPFLLQFIVPETASVPVGALAIGDQCKQCLEEGEVLSFTFGEQHY